MPLLMFLMSTWTFHHWTQHDIFFWFNYRCFIFCSSVVMQPSWLQCSMLIIPTPVSPSKAKAVKAFQGFSYCHVTAIASGIFLQTWMRRWGSIVTAYKIEWDTASTFKSSRGFPAGTHNYIVSTLDEGCKHCSIKFALEALPTIGSIIVHTSRMKTGRIFFNNLSHELWWQWWICESICSP